MADTNLSKNELKTLRFLSDGKTHKEDKPDDLTIAQYTVACRSLFNKGFIRAGFYEGGGLGFAAIKLEGMAVLDDKKEEIANSHNKNNDVMNTENGTVIFERKKGSGEIIQKKITAREICDIIRKYKKENVMQKKEWHKILCEITGLSESSFKSYL